MRTDRRPLSPGEEKVLIRIALLCFAIPLLITCAAIVPVPILTVVGAYREVGWAAPRCLFETRFSYDPQRQAPDRVFLAEPPEPVVATYLAGRNAVLERVEVDPEARTAVVWTRLGESDGREEVRPFGLHATRARRVEVDVGWGAESHLCYTRLGGWQLARERP